MTMVRFDINRGGVALYRIGDRGHDFFSENPAMLKTAEYEKNGLFEFK